MPLLNSINRRRAAIQHAADALWPASEEAYRPIRKTFGTTLISGFDYGVNSTGQRSGVTTAGTAFSGTPGWDWGYNARGEVVKADSSVTAFDRAYEYDAIGNRKKSADSLILPGSDNYASNALNQYTSIQQGGTGVSPVYDDDGNATAYPLPVSPTTNSTLVWDAENRMIATTVDGTTTNYLYDAQSRRIAKTTDTITSVYLYDAWNCIADYSGSAGVQKTYLWGKDLSGALQGAGGIGGLLAVRSSSSTHFATYDGNGNVSEYLAANGVTAHFEYDPFGRTVVDTDSAGLFEIRFQHEKAGWGTGLCYYGYRYYDPMTGRWPSRDPIEEEGGLNLYGFVGNDAIGKIDILDNK